MKLVIFLLKVILNIIYSIFKLFPVTDKITIISRQSNKMTQDIEKLEEELKKQLKEYKIIVLTKKIEKSFIKKMGYCFHMIIQMYHIATSKVVILDSYCIIISLLKHKKELKVIQMWHGIGTLKKSGYSILDRKEGRSSKIAKLMKMHFNYDYIFVSAEICRKDSAELFNYPIENVLVYPLPRTDLLFDENYKNNVIKKIKSEYPLGNKKNIVYAPTYREEEDSLLVAINNLIKNVDFNKYNLIIKLHPKSKIKPLDKNVILDTKFTTTEMMFIADYVIVDYSTVLFEAALLNKPLYFYAFDEKEYINNRDFYIDYHEEMPGVISDNSKVIMNAIKNNNYDLKKISNFSNKYVELERGKSTSNIVNFIKTLISR